MRIVKWVGLGLLALLVLLVVLNWSTIQRLRTVNSLFDADKIVGNFSSMDAAFLHHDLKIGEPQPWEEDLQDLPETVKLAGKETPLSDALTELDTTALVIIRDGKLIHESYYKGTGRDDLRISWSMAKSYMSGLYGQAIEDGLMDISKPIEFYLPQLKGTAYAGASVDDILNMTSGVRFNEDYLDPKSDINDMGRVLGLGGSMDDYTETLLDRQYEPGATWQYVSIDTHVAAMALRKVTGKSLHQLWEETYGAHLGMGKAPFYLTDGEDVAFALGGLNLRTRDYAKFGQLFLQNGQWEGEQLIPADWVLASTQNQAPNVHPIRGTGYGYQWWVPMPQEGPSKGDFFAVGIYGQYIYVNPAAGIVIAKNAADREFTVQQSNGQHSMNMNIDMFRSLARHFWAENFNSLSFEEQMQIRGQSFVDKITPRVKRNVVKFTGVDLKKNDQREVYRIFSQGSLNHTDMAFTVALDGEMAEVTYESRLRIVDSNHPMQKPLFKISLSRPDVSPFIKEFHALGVCDKELPKRIGKDGVNWLLETKRDDQYCADLLWGGSSPPEFLPMLKELDKILALNSK